MREIIKARVVVISLLPAGANKMPTLYKGDGDDGRFETLALTKTTEEGELLNVVYVPNRKDAHDDFMSKAAVKDMAHAAARDGVEIDIKHDGKVLDKKDIFVAEHFLVNKGDTRFQNWKDVDGKDVDLEGAYATVIKINDDGLRARVKSGELAQVSFAGPATVRAVKSADDPVGILSKLLKALGLGASSTTETEMKDSEIEALVTTSVEKALKAVDKAKTAADKAAADAKTAAATPKAVELDLTDPVAVKKHLTALEDAKGPDLTDPVAVKAHLEKLEKAELKKDVNFDDPKAVADYLEKITPGEDADEDDEDEDDLSHVDEVTKARLKKAERRSNRDPSDAKDAKEEDIYKAFDKKQRGELEAGSRMAKFINDGN